LGAILIGVIFSSMYEATVNVLPEIDQTNAGCMA